jgi:IPT/TIG domain-containing protein
MRTVVSIFGFPSQFTRWLRATWNLAVSRGPFRQEFQNPAARSSFWCLLTIALALGGLSCGTCGQGPFISSISPNSTPAGGNQFLMTVNGSDFRRDSLVSWSGSFRVTSFISSHQLAAAITAADIATPGSVLVLVFNPPSGNTTSVSGAIGNTFVMGCTGKDSNAVVFTISP